MISIILNRIEIPSSHQPKHFASPLLKAKDLGGYCHTMQFPKNLLLLVVSSAIPVTMAAFCDLVIEEYRDICAGGPGQSPSISFAGGYKLLKNGVDVVLHESKDFSTPADQTFTPAGTDYDIHTYYNGMSSFTTCAYNNGAGWTDGRTSTDTESNYCSRSTAHCKLIEIECDY